MIKAIWQKKQLIAVLLALSAQFFYFSSTSSSDQLRFDIGTSMQMSVSAFVCIMVFCLLADLFVFELADVEKAQQYKITIVFGAFGTAAYLLAGLDRIQSF